MTYQGYNPTGMPGAETPLVLQYPEVKAPSTEGQELEARSDS
jgi:hypothetical protein